ncbi:STAS domain-containing protein [Microbispora sp. SCL1-1]|uniref:STAS domain-containing protein n=1 Tax=unclassified Microbispora TaxID=2614687 RepID=UPI001157B827|nr:MULTISPECIES: STAS domain-containing protein [unclassified Microbispora]NJP29940.1 STAS domain-containing protein [Microbispora sp. CL1-1]TQS03535.1 STAS domain-containing protein [Microbispora sp. SCL1-1]
MSVTGPRSTLKVASTVHGAAVVVRVEGDLDAGTVHLLHDELDGLWKSPGTSVIVLDVAELGFCDSRGLSELISALQRGQALNVRFMLSGVQGVLRRVLTITGLRNVFEQHPTLAEALVQATDGGSDSDSGGLFETAGGR